MKTIISRALLRARQIAGRFRLYVRERSIERDPEFAILTPEQIMERDPSECIVSLPEVMRVFHLSEREIRQELATGRLVASGRPTSDGYTSVGITVDNLAHWMAATGRRISSTE